MGEELEYKEKLPVELKAGETLVLDITARPKKEEEPSAITTDGMPSVEFEVVDEKGQPVSDLSVVLSREDDTRFTAVVTDGKARFYDDMPSGIYSLHLGKGDFNVEPSDESGSS